MTPTPCTVLSLMLLTLLLLLIGCWRWSPVYLWDRWEHVSIRYRKCKRHCQKYNKGTCQLVEIYESPFLGRILTIDGDIHLCDFDEHRYHEMLVHVPMAYVPEQSQACVLVIDGGDGGVTREFCKYDPSIVAETSCWI